MKSKEAQYWLFISLLVVLIIIFSFGIAFIVFDGDHTMLAGVLAFMGSLLGGTITLIGVILTINHAKLSKDKEAISIKLNHIENAISFLEKVEEELAGYIKAVFIRGRKFAKYELYIDDELLNKYIIKYVSELKNELIFIDSEIYRAFLNFKELVTGLEFSWNKLLIDIDELNERLNENYEEEIEAEYRKKAKLIYEQEWPEIERQIKRKNKEIHYLLNAYYLDLRLQLASKHEKLILEMDY